DVGDQLAGLLGLARRALGVGVLLRPVLELRLDLGRAVRRLAGARVGLHLIEVLESLVGLAAAREHESRGQPAADDELLHEFVPSSDDASPVRPGAATATSR